MIAYAEALRRVVEAAREKGLTGHEEVPLAESLGRTCAASVFVKEPVPAFDNSAMDGYAVAAARTLGARVSSPVRLDVVGAVFAGDEPPCAARPGAWEITTGAALPAGTDAVVKVEDVSRADGGKSLLLASPAEAGDFVRRAGSDFSAGDALCEEGDVLDAPRLLALAAAGIASVKARKRPVVAVISTGRELVGPGKPLRPGQIRNATAPYLSAGLRALGAQVLDGGTAPDDPKDFAARLDAVLAKKPDAVLTTGAVSMGRHDFIAHSLAGFGARPVFHKTAIKPGKPILFAVLPQGALFFGLPGNPVSTAVGLRFFVAPALRALLGREAETPLRARLSKPVEKPEGLRAFLKARLGRQGALLTVAALEGQGSHQIKPLLSADAWLDVPAELSRAEAGTELDVYPLNPS